jgi:DNA mismatch endonuclease (patch repair protein)
MDPLSPSQRSKVMAQVRGKDTKPEMRVRTTVHGMGLRFRLHRRGLKGTPDLVFPKYKVAIFVHGCFWHQHPGCKRASMPQNREDFWRAKLARNVERDTEAELQLRSEGWRVEIIWECETKDAMQIRKRVEKIFGRSRTKRQKPAGRK